MTSLNLSERMNELSDAVIRPFNANEGGEMWVHIEVKSSASLSRTHKGSSALTFC
jgi:hypothetical protein